MRFGSCCFFFLFSSKHDEREKNKSDDDDIERQKKNIMKNMVCTWATKYAGPGNLLWVMRWAQLLVRERALYVCGCVFVCNAYIESISYANETMRWKMKKRTSSAPDRLQTAL